MLALWTVGIRAPWHGGGGVFAVYVVSDVALTVISSVYARYAHVVVMLADTRG